MIRQTGIIERNANWSQKDYRVTDPEELRTAWMDWAAYESIKRYVLALLITFTRLCILIIFPPSFLVSAIFQRDASVLQP